MKKIFLTLLVFYSVLVAAQERYYSNPLKIPLLLSGSFAELRSNHFHSGIDIKTQGVIGQAVYAVADGYISRISVSPSGFGNAIYIDHTNGTTTVYGHLNAFREDIQEYVKNQQYKEESFRVDLKLPPYLFPVTKDDQIAKSGNSGSSGGPHLHFEIRDTKTEETLNPLQFGFPVTDNTPPKIFGLQLAPLSEFSHVNYGSPKKKYPVVFYEGKYHIKNNPTIPVYGEIGFAVQTNDYFNGSYNKCGIYSLNLKIDGEIYFSFQIDKFSFDDTRFINSHIDYAEYIKSKHRYQKAWLDPGNELPIYKSIRGNGVFEANDGNIHHVEIELKDTYGNTSEIVFNIESKFKEIKSTTTKFNTLFNYSKSNHFENDELSLEIPGGALYDDLKFYNRTIQSGDSFYSNIHVLHKNTVPLHKSAEIQIKTKEVPNSLESKMLLVNLDTISGRYYAMGGEYDHGWVTSKIRYFGNYVVAVDSIPPKIVPLSIKNKAAITESQRIRFKISDNLSGIKKVEGYLDGKWALFEYDAKKHLISHYFDSTRFELKKRHQFILKVTDYKNNTGIYEASFWK